MCSNSPWWQVWEVTAGPHSWAVGWIAFLYPLCFLSQGRLLLPYQPRGMSPCAVIHVPQQDVPPRRPRAAEDGPADPGATPFPLHRPSGCCQVQVSMAPGAVLLQRSSADVWTHCLHWVMFPALGTQCLRKVSPELSGVHGAALN